MGEEGLHRAAQKRRDRELADALAASRAAIRKADRARGSEERVKEYRVREALAEAGWRGKLFTGAALCLGLFGPMAIAILFFDTEAWIPLVIAVIGSMVGAFAGMAAGEIVLAGIRRWRVMRIGRGFDPHAYLAALGENRRNATLVVRVRFARPWREEARASAPDAAREWMPTLTSVAWDGDVLELRRISIECTEWISGGESTSGGRFFNNRKLHGCFIEILDDVVPRLEDVAPIAKLEVSIEGTIEDWNADA